MNFVLSTNHPRDDTASLPQYVTTWRENELRGAVMGLQWLNWRYMPRNELCKENSGWMQPLDALLPLLYPDEVCPATSAPASGDTLLRLDPETDWQACLNRDSLRLPRAVCYAPSPLKFR